MIRLMKRLYCYIIKRENIWLAGHEDIRMTQRYSHHCPESLRDGVEALEVDCNLTTMKEKGRFETSQNLS